MKKIFAFLITAVLAASLLSSPLTAVAADAKKAVGTTIRLEKTEGTVTLENQNGTTLPTRKDMKLSSGYKLSTDVTSYAYVNLDDSKVVKLDEASSVSVKKSGKKLELLVNSGKVFFNVKKPLEADETMEIRTANMVTGIRGTAGEIICIDEKSTQVALFDGKISLTSVDPKTGKTKDVAVLPGTIATITETVGGGAVALRPLTVNDISGSAAKEIAGDKTLQQRIEKETTIDVKKVVATADEKLKKEQTAKLDEKKKADENVKAKEDALTPTPDPKPDGGNSGSGSGGNNDGGGSVTPPEPPKNSITLWGGDVTVEKFKAALAKYDAVHLEIGDFQKTTFLFKESYDIPAGKTVYIETGMLTLDGEGPNPDLEPVVSNHGQIIVESRSALVNEACLYNYGTIKATAERANINPLIENRFTFENISGTIDGGTSVAIRNQNAGNFTMTDGEVTSESESATITTDVSTFSSSSPSITIKDGLVKNTADSGSAITLTGTATCTIEGGTVTSGAVGISLDGTSKLTMSNGTIAAVQTGIVLKGTSTCAISDGTITSEKDIGISVGSTAPTSLTINGGVISAKIIGVLLFKGTTCNITDGTVTSEEGGISLNNDAKCTITGGTISDIGANSTSQLTIEGGTITGGVSLNDDATCAISGNTVITGELGGIGANSTSTLTITGGTITGGVSLNDDAECTISGGKIKSETTGIALNGSSKLAMSDGTVTGKTAAIMASGTGTLTLMITGGTITSETTGVMLNGDSQLTMGAGTVSGDKTGIEIATGATCTINGGRVASIYRGIVNNGGTADKLKINGGIVECTIDNGGNNNELAIDGAFAYNGNAIVRAKLKVQVCTNIPVGYRISVTPDENGWYILELDV